MHHGPIGIPVSLGLLASCLAGQDVPPVGLGEFQAYLEQPVHSANKRLQRLKDAPADMTVLRGGDLAGLGYRTLGDALGGVLGFRANQDRAYTGLGVRGLYPLGDQNTRVLVLLDGHPLNSAAEVGSGKAGEDFGIPMDLVERIEVVRGPSSSLYGNNAFLGLVNVVTRKPDARPIGGQVITTQSSRALSGLDGILGGARGYGWWQVMVSGMQRKGSPTHFPELAPGALAADLDREERQSAYLRAAGSDWIVSGYTTDRTQRLASAPFGATPGAPGNAYRNRVSFAELRWRPTLGPVTGLVRAFGDRNEFSAGLDYDGTRTPNLAGLCTESDPNWNLGLELQARCSPRPGLELVAGHERTRQRFSGFQDLTGTQSRIGVRHGTADTYVQAEWTPADAFTATAGLQSADWTVTSVRLEDGATSAAYPARTWSGITPRLALVWRPTAVDILKALYGGGFRNPTLFEAYYQDQGSCAANPGLCPERIVTFQGIWVRTWPSGLQSQLSASRSRWRHTVHPVRLDDGRQQYQNDPDSLIGTALEAELQGRWGPWVLYGQVGRYAWREAGQDFLDSTDAQGALRLTRNWGPWSASAEVRYVGRRTGGNGPAGGGAPAATVLRMAGRWEGRRIWIRVTGEDLGQARETDLVGQEYAPIIHMAGDGRTFLLALGLPF